ncbi:YbhB/YbcL family Raf kinase inhibitor-like protein [Candidatus Woesearchaeota archaeon]|nr:YbhB/YbcL family Raf kinase inhibitor-like protein [Candidatus Woesearchaeota archaeon]
MPSLQLTSSAFSNNGKIPSLYTCDGSNTSPPLSISGVPAEAKSLVLLMDDPDIPEFVKQKFGITVWDHWVVFNIPPTTAAISEGKNPPGVFGKNTGGKNAYGGPCPPDREHRYFFKLYALDTLLDLPAGATKTAVEQAMKGRVLAEARLVGLYERK